MSWHWVGEPAISDSSLDKTFHTQGEAETWIGEFYPDLLDDGVKAVTLYEEDRRVYGPMGLDPDIR
jgi:hypothetical protein